MTTVSGGSNPRRDLKSKSPSQDRGRRLADRCEAEAMGRLLQRWVPDEDVTGETPSTTIDGRIDPSEMIAA